MEESSVTIERIVIVGKDENMLKYFTVIAGLATLIGTFHSFLKGTGFYVASAVSILFALGTLVVWYQSERVSHLRAMVYPLLVALLKNIGAEVVPLVVEIAERPGMQNEVVAALEEVLHIKPDPTERHWIYIALGKIESKKTKSALKKGLSDENEFARLGAEESWKLIENSEERRRR
jgi:hypothetical protein